MTAAPHPATELLKRPTRADARRNYDRLIEAARAAFQEDGGDASLEAIAKRAEVGIGTLYRNFPTRSALLEAVYAEEVEAIAAAAQDVADLPPWEALEAWLRHYARYSATKRAISEELIASLGADSPVLTICRTLLLDAGEPLVKRAQEAGELRNDITFIEIARMLGALVTAKGAGDEEKAKLFGVALDGLRVR
ncbi:MAG: TetR/AcrR family transcriptional regulator [Solirubrobacteraceae bacterium]|nr:TetR/AcrR family transcriptional regulator [Solirubrobacteraceae bacterium]